MVAWCLDLDGRQDKDECAKPIVVCGTGPAVDRAAVFSLVRFQEKEMRKTLQGNLPAVGGGLEVHLWTDDLMMVAHSQEEKGNQFR